PPHSFAYNPLTLVKKVPSLKNNAPRLLVKINLTPSLVLFRPQSRPDEPYFAREMTNAHFVIEDLRRNRPPAAPPRFLQLPAYSYQVGEHFLHNGFCNMNAAIDVLPSYSYSNMHRVYRSLERFHPA